MRRPLLCLFLLLFGLTPAMAGSVRLDIDILTDRDTDSDTGKVKRKYTVTTSSGRRSGGTATGKSRAKDQEILYTAKVRNRGFSDVEGLTLVAHIYEKSIKNDKVTKTTSFTTDEFDLAYNEETKIELGEAAFSYYKTKTVIDGVHYDTAEGNEYAGFGVQVYQGKELVYAEASNNKIEKLMKKETR
ncbi:MAG: hypothetical protein AAGK14_13545 [Verrucomicrobiota bacterium]